MSKYKRGNIKNRYENELTHSVINFHICKLINLLA